MDKYILGVIPARSGSTGVKNKNIREIDGKPLIEYTIKSAKNSELLNDFLVSTDSDEIASIADSAGAPVPFLRPDEYATDESPMIDVAKHALTEYESTTNKRVDLIVILQPTSPFREADDIDGAIEAFDDSDAESLLSCYKSLHAHPFKMYEMKRENQLIPLRNQDERPSRRQDFSPIYVLNGAIFISTRNMILKEEKIYDGEAIGYQMPLERSINIDIEYELKIADLLLKNDIDLPRSPTF